MAQDEAGTSYARSSQEKAKLKAVIFDLGNTLVKFTGDLNETNFQGVKLIHRVISLDGIHIDFERLLKVWTKERVEGIIRASATLKEVTADQVFERVMQLLGIPELNSHTKKRAVDAFFTPEIEKYTLDPHARGILEFLKEKNLKIGLISNTTCHRFVERLLKKFDLTPYFDVIMSSAGEGIRKPDPEIFRRALERLKTDPQETLMVGDLAEHDVKGAKLAGLKAVLLNHGQTGSVTPDYTIEKLKDLERIILKEIS